MSKNVIRTIGNCPIDNINILLSSAIFVQKTKFVWIYKGIRLLRSMNIFVFWTKIRFKRVGRMFVKRFDRAESALVNI